VRGLALVLLALALAVGACGIKGEPDPRVDLPEPQIVD
jgi:predicted small lipoprotein YifL